MKDVTKIKVETNVYEKIIKEIDTFPTEQESLKKLEEETIKIGTIQFTEKEIEKMPKDIKKLIIVNKKRCRIRLKKSGKNSFTYEIRFRCDGYNVSASGKTIELAKIKMVEKLKTAKPTKIKVLNYIPTTFDSFSNYYFENFRKETVTKKTMKNDLNRYKNYLEPYFKEKEIKKITPLECKKLLESVKEKGKTCDELHSLLNIIFKIAIKHNIIKTNPLNMVLHIKHEKKHGKALTKEEEYLLINSDINSEIKILIAIMLYCGLRPNEIEKAEINGNFIATINSKRKNKKIEYKKIPICNKLKVFLKNGIPEKRNVAEITKEYKKILPNHILYDLRTTFNTKCNELGIHSIARDLFMGHSLGTLQNTYTDVSDEYLLKEGEKLNKW